MAAPVDRVFFSLTIGPKWLSYLLFSSVLLFIVVGGDDTQTHDIRLDAGEEEEAVVADASIITNKVPEHDPNTKPSVVVEQMKEAENRDNIVIETLTIADDDSEEIKPEDLETFADKLARLESRFNITIISSFLEAAKDSYKLAKELIHGIVDDEVDNFTNTTESVEDSTIVNTTVNEVEVEEVVEVVTNSTAKDDDNKTTLPEAEFTIQSKVKCIGKNVTDNRNGTVLLVNSTTLHSLLSNKNNVTGYCAVVMFFAPWCLFCARAAPHYNALGRAFPQMDVLAIDAVHFSSWNVRYGTIAVPNIILFHNGRQVSRFNGTERTFPNLLQFVSNITGFLPVVNLTVVDMDYEGPVPSQPIERIDYLLIVAWLFVITCCVTMCLKSTRFNLMYTKVVALWQEHQHLD